MSASGKTRWTPEELQRVIRYGLCPVCRAPRDVTRSGDGTYSELICPNGCDQDRDYDI